MKLMSTFAALAISMFAVAAPAHAEMFGGKLNVKLGVAGVLPDEAATIQPIGGSVEISDEYVPAVQLEYFLSEKVSLELLCCVAPHEVEAVNTAAGRVDLGKVTLFPPTLTAKYHFDFGSVKPYVGAGVNYTVFFNEDLPGGVATSISYEDTFGVALQGGFDVPLSKRASLNVDLKKIWIEPEVTINNSIRADVEINPLVAFVGIGYRF